MDKLNLALAMSEHTSAILAYNFCKFVHINDGDPELKEYLLEISWNSLRTAKMALNYYKASR